MTNRKGVNALTSEKTTDPLSLALVPEVCIPTHSLYNKNVWSSCERISI